MLAAILYTILGVAILLAIFIIIFCCYEERFFYRPRTDNRGNQIQDGYTKTHDVNGESVTVTIKNIEVLTEDGVILRGYHVSPSN